jgi:tRNA (guanosine-2'-O-)-methyltransferase
MYPELTYQQKCEFYEFFCNFATENRKQRFEEVINNRTRFLTIVLEDIYQPQNASAVLRTCDCFGIQDVHIIENANKYQVNPDVALGSSNWLTLYNYNTKEANTADCLNNLKKQGYTLIAATPHENDLLLDDITIDRKTAIIFGTEKGGLSEAAHKFADSYMKIPMYGFTESFNISVSAAITLFSLTERLRKSEIDWHLSKEELIDIKIEWIKKSVSSSELIEKQYLQQLFEKPNKQYSK